MNNISGIIINFDNQKSRNSVMGFIRTTSDVDVACLLLLHRTSAVEAWETLSPAISNTFITTLTALTPNAPLPPFCNKRSNFHNHA